MILPSNASLIISVAQQLIKLGGRIDSLLAEKTAVQSQIVLGMPAVRIDDILKQKELVRSALELTKPKEGKADPFGTDRAILIAELEKSPVGADFNRLFRKYFPDADTPQLIDPDAAYLAKLKQACPGLNWKDPAVRLAAFTFAAGSDNRQITYSARIALSVMDTLLEFGAENTALLVHDQKVRDIAELVLQRFAEPEWDQFENWNPLLQSALRSVLNAALDVGEKLPPENPLLGDLLDVLLAARQNAAQPDDFVLGLVRGEGVHALLAQGLLVVGDRLNQNQSKAFKLVMADLLSEGATLIATDQQTGFRTFFNDHWGDLLRAGFSSLEKHGDVLLDDQSPLLRTTLKAVAHQLAQTDNRTFLRNEILYRLTDTVVGAVADHPDQLTGLEDKAWLRELIGAIAQTAQQLTTKNLFTKDAADALLSDVISVFAQHPDLVITEQGLPLALCTGVLNAVAQNKQHDARTVSETAIRAAFIAIGSDPTLASGKFGPTLVAITTKLASLVGQGRLSGSQASELITVAIEAIVRNPPLFTETSKDIASVVIEAVYQKMAGDPARPWTSRLLIPVTRAALLAVARAGGKMSGQSSNPVKQLVAEVVAGGLQLATTRLGRNVDLDGIPSILGGLIAQTLQGALTTSSPKAAEFIAAFDALAAALPRT